MRFMIIRHSDTLNCRLLPRQSDLALSQGKGNGAIRNISACIQFFPKAGEHLITTREELRVHSHGYEGDKVGRK